MSTTKGLTEQKAALITKAYYDARGYGSMKKTLQDVKKLEGGKNIRYEDIQAWFNKNLSQKTTITRYNSYVPHEPKDESQGEFFRRRAWKIRSLP